MAKPKESIPILTPLNFKDGKFKINSQEKSMDVGEYVDKYDPTIFCRTCASVDPCLVPIFREEGLEYDLNTKIEKYLPIRVSEKDDLPVHICYHCASTLIAWDSLIKGCVEAEKKLTSLKNSLKSKESDEVDEVGELIIDEIDSDDEPLIAKESTAEHIGNGDEEKRDILQEKNGFQGLLEPIDVEPERLVEAPDLSFSNYRHQFSMYRLLYFEIFSLRIEGVICCNICTALEKLKMRFLKSLTKENGKRMLVDKDPLKKGKEQLESDKKLLEPVTMQLEPVKKQTEPVKKRVEPVKDLPGLIKMQLNPVKKRLEPVKELPELIKVELEPVKKRIGPVKEPLEPVKERIELVKEQLEPVKVLVEPGQMEFTPKSEIVCERCGKVFSSRTRWKYHMKIHNGGKPCDQCTKVFTCSFKLLRHMKIVHEGLKDHVSKLRGKQYRSRSEMHKIKAERIVCKDCGRMHVSKAFYLHKKLYRKLKPWWGVEKPFFSCDECHKTFTTKKSKNDHMLIHTGEKPMNCSICNKNFRTKKGMEQHMLIHTGVKPFVCEFCGKAFGRKDHLRIHVRCHTGEKPYTCEYCGKGSTQLTVMKRHIKTHEKLLTRSI